MTIKKLSWIHLLKNRFRTIVDEYAQLIRSGEISAGTRLPTHRQLASLKAISLVTATRVYTELAIMGLVSGETGRGTFVRDLSLPPSLGVEQHAMSADTRDLNFNYPALSYQTELLRETLRQLITQGDLEALLRYQPHAGRINEREIIANYVSTNEYQPNANNVLIVNGAQHGLAVTLMGLLQPGDIIVVDALTYPGFKILASELHLELLPLPMHPQGIDLKALERLCLEWPVKAIYTMPTLHNPLGWVLSYRQRKQMVAIANRYNLLIIEDAAYAYLVKNAPAPIAAFAPDRTIYITSFSKNIAAGLRIGAIICPPAAKTALERAIRATTWNTPVLITTLVCSWLQNGTARRLEILKRRDARKRQRLARRILAPLQPVSNENAYFLWLPLPDEVRSEPLVRLLLNDKISVSTAAPFSVNHHPPQAIRLALGSMSIPQLEEALNHIRDVILDCVCRGN